MFDNLFITLKQHKTRIFDKGVQFDKKDNGERHPICIYPIGVGDLSRIKTSTCHKLVRVIMQLVVEKTIYLWLDDYGSLKDWFTSIFPER